MLINPTERLQSLATDSRSGSISHRLRERRFRLLSPARRAAAAAAADPRRRGDQHLLGAARLGGPRTTCRSRSVNLEAEERRHENIHPTAGDATDLADYADKRYDIAFSATRSSSTSTRSRTSPRWPPRCARRARLLGADAELLVPDRAALPRAGAGTGCRRTRASRSCSAAVSAGPAHSPRSGLRPVDRRAAPADAPPRAGAPASPMPASWGSAVGGPSSPGPPSAARSSPVEAERRPAPRDRAARRLLVSRTRRRRRPERHCARRRRRHGRGRQTGRRR